ncbi:hypothetical protein NGA_0427600 [Nannochloropsis gaditana CCMP526]|uniref:Uncharacterized protein n=2 Tax=Nannochloropsis gaditana TaxID=72520 RepID=W7TK28_9STRA|nr:hypothetical protein NGA_0427600 [Nannochloropsis gaditana CCMP526]EKU22417.1 hypothetical protein NGA_0427600 [Nannochloropsis gaditana CCMP526]EWM26437.1 hypothetical protein Naga_100344g5 [Nannochloropsis gaditana]|eukprot:XP_005853940.1 hypothetical protein NGA_0427600 [Nannochloropsis gaditana CCMP526]
MESSSLWDACTWKRLRIRRRANASSSCFHCVATLLLLLLLLISDGIEAFVLPVSALKRPSSRAMVHLSPTDADTAPRCRFLLHQLATVAGGIFLGGVTGNVGGHTEAQASDQVITQSYIEQVRDAIPVKTIRGVWRIREYRDRDQPLCKGRIKMRGFVEEPNKGTLEYTGCNDGKGKGNWLLKPARIANGQIRFSARWKVRFSDGESLIYRGDVLAGGNYAKASASITDGEILKPFTGITGNLSEKKVGTFEADLIQVSDDEEKL